MQGVTVTYTITAGSAIGLFTVTVMIGGVAAMLEAIIQRRFGSVSLWVAATMACAIWPLGFWSDLVQAWGTGDAFDTVGAVGICAVGFSFAPALGIWLVRKRTPQLTYWRHAGVGLLAMYGFFGGLVALALLAMGTVLLYRAL